MDLTAFWTSPPSIPPSALFKTQGPVPGSHPSQHLRTTSQVSQCHSTSQALGAQHKDQEAGENDPQMPPSKVQRKHPMPTYKDNDSLASTTHVPQAPVPHSKFTPRLSQTPVSVPQKTWCHT
ncbi:hypothetical protein BDM02DRAFT_3194125 [Thelephora ganbajun]|uniref:Uncharacterized protein n=1 Tax=Thelephora ganbajun TaxID=370292 RepID=A0ACB6YXL1_THEGA|nr:hypothetical protein BDM02DRAFT_3194125 [Thelephora ganbajun]